MLAHESAIVADDNNGRDTLASNGEFPFIRLDGIGKVAFNIAEILFPTHGATHIGELFPQFLQFIFQHGNFPSLLTCSCCQNTLFA